MTPEERYSIIDRNIQVITELLLQTAERQSTTEHLVEQNAKAAAENAKAIADITGALRIDAENIAALARIAEAREHRISDIEEGLTS